MADSLPERLGRHLADLAAGAALSGTRRRERGGRGRHGGDRQHRKRGRPDLLGVVVGPHHAPWRRSRSCSSLQVVLFWVLPDLSSSAALIAIAFAILMCYGGGFGTMPAPAAGLVRRAKRRTDLRADADRVGTGERLRAADDGRDAAQTTGSCSRRAAHHRRRDGHFDAASVDAPSGTEAIVGSANVTALLPANKHCEAVASARMIRLRRASRDRRRIRCR